MEFIVAEVAILTFVAGFVVGVAVKGIIDRRFEKKVQESLIRVGQMADDEIEEKDKKINKLENAVKELQLELAVYKLNKLKEIDA